jgi:hypothetical protein
MPSGVYNRTTEYLEYLKSIGFQKGVPSIHKGKPNPYAKKLPQLFKKGCKSLMKGKHHTDDAKRKLSASKLGIKYPNRKLPPPFSDTHRKNISLAHKGKEMTWLKGKKLSNERRMEMSRIQKLRVLDGRHNNYKGGITPINHLIRESIEAKLWKDSIFARDNWTCQRCQIRGSKLAVHHIKPFAHYIELRFALDNGITLCAECHKLFHKTYGCKQDIYQKLTDFLESYK